MKIAVYTITKNEEKHVARWAESCKEADYRLIVDTGSTDNTVSIAMENGCEVGFITVRPWRFDDARNAALAMIPDDIDMCVSLDADEILMPGWRQHLEALPPEITRPRYKYVWSWNPDGSEGLTFLRDHIHKRHGYRWKHPVHEILVPTGYEVQGYCGLEVHHHPDASKSRGQYLTLLELAVKEDPTGDRNMFYYGRELMYYGKNAEAATYLKKHIEISTWAPERAASMRYLARVTGEREPWLLKSAAEAPDRREPWVELAQYYYDTAQWEMCLAAAKRALSIKEKPLEYICEASAWGSLPYDLASIAAWNVGLLHESLGLGKKALSIDPYDARLRENVAAVIRSLRRNLVDVVIPTKSNVDGLERLLETIKQDSSVGTIYVVADGDESRARLESLASDRVVVARSPLSAGIQHMWNVGLGLADAKRHVMFLNDDVTITSTTCSTLAGQLDLDGSIGLICPNYDRRYVAGTEEDVVGACGVYGKQGVAGASMMLRASLASEWRFDERMKWYFGDDDLALWALRSQSMRTVVSGLTSCHGNDSWTIQNDPPVNFKNDTEVDKRIFDEKWPNYAS